MSAVNSTACLPKCETICWNQAASCLRHFAIEDLEIRDRKSREKDGKKTGGSELTITLSDTERLRVTESITCINLSGSLAGL